MSEGIAPRMYRRFGKISTEELLERIGGRQVRRSSRFGVPGSARSRRFGQHHGFKFNARGGFLGWRLNPAHQRQEVNPTGDMARRAEHCPSFRPLPARVFDHAYCFRIGSNRRRSSPISTAGISHDPRR